MKAICFFTTKSAKSSGNRHLPSEIKAEKGHSAPKNTFSGTGNFHGHVGQKQTSVIYVVKCLCIGNIELLKDSK